MENKPNLLGLRVSAGCHCWWCTGAWGRHIRFEWQHLFWEANKLTYQIRTKSIFGVGDSGWFNKTQQKGKQIWLSCRFCRVCSHNAEAASWSESFPLYTLNIPVHPLQCQAPHIATKQRQLIPVLAQVLEYWWTLVKGMFLRCSFFQVDETFLGRFQGLRVCSRCYTLCHTWRFCIID